MNNLDICLKKTIEEAPQSKQNERFLHHCILEHRDITNAKSFDPFTHVYMFDVGFPPTLLQKLAEIYNFSQSQYLICYHGPKIMKKHGFEIELIQKVDTKMHGSGRSHTGYIYCRASPKKNENINLFIFNEIPCDDLFQYAWKKSKQDLQSIHEEIKQQIMIDRLTSNSKRACLQPRGLVKVASGVSSNKSKKRNKIGKTSMTLKTTKRDYQFIHMVSKFVLVVDVSC